MAGNVTGNIGGSNVILDNAATEATLQMLLQATLATTKEQKKAISDLVQKAGMDPAKVAEANQGLSELGKTASATGAFFGGVNTAADQLSRGFSRAASIVEKLTDNQGKSSDIFAEFSKMGGIIGLFATGLGMAAKFQEKQLETYQSLTQNGISFGGSLTEMRRAASGMYLTMDQFSKLMKENSQTFAKMGGSADEGAQAFTKVSQELMKGPLGRNLQALGYTAEQVNSGLATYMDTIGALGANGEKDQKKLAASAAEYMTQLDALSEITGKSKDEQLQAAKERAANAAWEAKLMTMAPEERKKAEAAAAEALARGGKGAEQALMSAVMGFPPMTKAAREYTALAQNMNGVTLKQARAVTDSTKTMEDMKKIGTEYNAAAVKDKALLGQSGQAIIMAGGPLANTIANITGTANRAQKQGADTQAAAEAQAKAAEANQKKRQEAEAAAAVDTQRAVMEMGQEILEMLLPAFKALQPIIKDLVEKFSGLLKWINDTIGPANALKIAIAAAAGYTAVKGVQGVAAVRSAVSGAFGSGPVAGPTGGGGGGGIGKSLGGVADGLGRIGPMLASLGKGAGDLFKGIMVGIGSGIKVFANPLVIAGSAGFGVAIAAIGAGIAAASWIMGKALPTLAEGLSGFDDLDGKALGEVGLGMIQMGAGLVTFGAGGAIASVGSVVGGLAEKFGSFFGAKSPIEKMKEFASLGPMLGQAGTGMSNFNTSLANLLKTDTDKISNLAGNLKNLAVSLNELKQASKPVEKGFLDLATEKLKSTLTTEVTRKPVTPPPAPTPAQDSSASATNLLNTQLAALIRSSLETAENTKRAASILASRGNALKG